MLFHKNRKYDSFGVDTCAGLRGYIKLIQLWKVFSTPYLVFDLVMKHCIFFSLRKQLTFHDATTGFPLN